MSNLTYMKKSKTLKTVKKAPSKNGKLLLVLGIGLATLLFTYFRDGTKPQKADIFLIDDKSSQFGETEIIGKVQKDTAIGVEGNYFLLTTDNKYILIDTKEEMDGFIGSKVIIKGFLTPATNLGQPETIKVYTLRLE